MEYKLFAKIKKSSKYYYQNELAADNHQYGLPFAVDIEGDGFGYAVQGGPGGQYFLKDVILYIIGEGGKFIKIS